MRIPLQRPYFSKAEETAVISTLRSGWVAQGPKVAEFEKLVADYVGAKYAVATTSATSALFLSLYILGIGAGDEVIVPSLSFIASANVIVQVGAKPIFVDVDPRTYNIDPLKIEASITKRTKAILPVDQVGLPCDLTAIRKIAKKHDLFIVEDAACALGSEYKDKRIGSINNFTCFSFHPRKLITTGEGGMIATNNKKYAERAKMLRHHGMSVSDLARHNAKKVIHEGYREVGYNFRMSDLQAAVGVEQMKKLPIILRKRKLLSERYTETFIKSELIIPPFVPEGYKHNWQTYVIKLKKNKMISRDVLMQKLFDVGISTRIGIMAAHLEAPYRKMYPKISLPETDTAANETIALPLYAQMTVKEQNYVINNILSFTNVK